MNLDALHTLNECEYAILYYCGLQLPICVSNIRWIYVRMSNESQEDTKGNKDIKVDISLHVMLITNMKGI